MFKYDTDAIHLFGFRLIKTFILYALVRIEDYPAVEVTEVSTCPRDRCRTTLLPNEDCWR